MTPPQILPDRCLAAPGLASSPPPGRAGSPTSRLLVAPASRLGVQGGVATYTLSIAGQNGFDGTVSLAVSGLPAGADGRVCSLERPGVGLLHAHCERRGRDAGRELHPHRPGRPAASLVRTARRSRLPVTAAAAAPAPSAAQTDVLALGDAGRPDRQVRQVGARSRSGRSGARGPVRRRASCRVQRVCRSGSTARSSRWLPGVWTLHARRRGRRAPSLRRRPR